MSSFKKIEMQKVETNFKLYKKLLFLKTQLL